MRQTLIRLGLPEQEVEQYNEAVRRDRYETEADTTSEQQALEQLLRTSYKEDDEL